MEQRNRAKDNFRLSDTIHRVDPYGGVLVITTCWRPRPDDPNPEQPGDRVSLQIYHPTNPQDFCPCGSGKRFAACCQWLPYWRLVCPNPWQGYSLIHPQSARFTNIPYKAVHAFLQDDERLHCIEDTPQRAFWIYWGNPAFAIPQGRLCFGDIELLENQTLLLTALSDTRMELLLELIQPLNLGTPEIHKETIIRLEKSVQTASRRKHRRPS